MITKNYVVCSTNSSREALQDQYSNRNEFLVEQLCVFSSHYTNLTFGKLLTNLYFNFFKANPETSEQIHTFKNLKILLLANRRAVVALNKLSNHTNDTEIL